MRVADRMKGVLKMFTRIIVPLDGSDIAAQALPCAVILAEKFGAALTLASVLLPRMPDLGTADVLGFPFGRRRAAEDRAILVADDYLDSIAAPLRARGLAVEIDLIRGGDAAAEIVAAATEPGTLIVMSTHGRTGFDRLRLGSVAQAVARRAASPTLIVRAQADVPKRDVASIQQITVTLDGSPLAESALPIASRLAQIFNVPLTLLRVIPNVVYPTAYYDTAYLPPIKELEAYARTEAEQYLAEIKELQELQDVRVQWLHSAASTPEAIINAYLAKQPPGIVVMASHGRGGVSRWILGSTAEGVVTGAPCPVLIVRAETAPATAAVNIAVTASAR
jgi:nucleotide-binding universal stress UspA family protein